ncbi:MAG: tetratricopeptide repeat protein [Burkholderiales bacterium]
MRYAEFAMRLVAALAPLAFVVLLTLSGCASVGDSLQAVKDAVTPAPSTAAASAPIAARPVAAVVEAPVNPNAQRSYDEANRALRAGRTADAERGYRALVQSNPELGGPHANLGVILRRAGKLPEAAAEFEQATKLNPKQPVYLNQLGITYRQLGQFDKARDAYERAIAADAAYAPATLNLGILNDMYLGDAKRAAELYDRYLALSPGGDAVVTKWIAELKNRKTAPVAAARKEKA